MKFFLLLTGALFLISSHVTQAQTEDPILSLPEGQAIITLSATETTEVEQNLLTASLEYIQDGRDSRSVQDNINDTMKKALDEAKGFKDVKTHTTSYRIYEYTEPRTKEKKWRGSQGLTIKSTNSEDVLKLTGKLQDMGLTIQNLSYSVDPDTAAKVQDELMEAALAKLQSRAERAAKALGKSSANLRDISLNEQLIAPPMMMRGRAQFAMAESASVSAPVAEAGESRISLTVSARALLKP